jgi:hypothetical protein
VDGETEMQWNLINCNEFEEIKKEKHDFVPNHTHDNKGKAVATAKGDDDDKDNDDLKKVAEAAETPKSDKSDNGP